MGARRNATTERSVWKGGHGRSQRRPRIPPRLRTLTDGRCLPPLRPETLQDPRLRTPPPPPHPETLRALLSPRPELAPDPGQGHGRVWLTGAASGARAGQVHLDPAFPGALLHLARPLRSPGPRWVQRHLLFVLTPSAGLRVPPPPVPCCCARHRQFPGPGKCVLCSANRDVRLDVPEPAGRVLCQHRWQTKSP